MNNISFKKHKSQYKNKYLKPNLVIIVDTGHLWFQPHLHQIHVYSRIKISTALDNKDYYTVAFLGISKAFNNAWYKYLILKIKLSAFKCFFTI